MLSYVAVLVETVDAWHQVESVYHFVSQPDNDAEQLEPWLQKEMDSCISNVFLNEDQDAFIQLFNLILYENVNGMAYLSGIIHYTILDMWHVNTIRMVINAKNCAWYHGDTNSSR